MNHDYNTQRTRMALPEYGRNVQKMVEHIRTIKDRDERNRAARTIIQIMSNLNPNLRDTGDVKHKLWDHLTIIADFDLDIDPPYPQPKREVLAAKPSRVEYQSGEVKYLHYGRVVTMMIEEAAKMEAGEERDYLVTLIANQMKKASASWNRGNVTDEVIVKDLIEISGNKVTVPPDIKLLEVKELLGPRKKKPQPRQNKSTAKRKYQGKH